VQTLARALTCKSHVLLPAPALSRSARCSSRGVVSAADAGVEAAGADRTGSGAVQCTIGHTSATEQSMRCGVRHHDVVMSTFCRCIHGLALAPFA